MAILTAVFFGSCFVDVDDTYHPPPPTPAPYKLRMEVHTPMLEPLQLYFSGRAGNHSADTESCLSGARIQAPVFTRRFSVEPPSERGGKSGSSCESGTPALPTASYSWPEAGTGGNLLGSYWQLQKFRPFSATLQVFGNSGRLTAVSMALDDQFPGAVVRFSDEGAVELKASASNELKVSLSRAGPVRIPTDGYDFPWYDTLAELRIEIDSSRLSEGSHRLSFTVESPEIEAVRRSIVRNGQVVVQDSEEPTSRFTYSACLDVLLNATSLKTGPDGTLWIGTFEHGLMKVDLGKTRDRTDDLIQFLQGDSVDTGPLGLPKVSGDLSGNSISRLAFDPSGNLWIGTLFHDFAVMREGSFTAKYDTSDVDEFDFDWSMLSAGGEERLARYISQELSDTVTGFAFLSDKEVMIATLNGLYYLNHQGTLENQADDRWVRFDQKDGLADANLIGIEVDKRGLVWIATTDLSDEDQPGENDGEGLYVLDMNGTPGIKSDDRWANFTPEEGKFDERILMFAQDADGGKWLGAIGGLFYLNDGGTPFDKSDDQWAKFGAADGFIDEDISSIYFRGPGRYLLGAVDILSPEPNTPPGGALILMDLDGKPHEKKIKNLVHYTIDDGFADADVSSIELDKFGRVAFSSFNFFHSPLVTTLYSVVELKSQTSGSALSPTGNIVRVPLGRDGVTFVDLGPDETGKADDQIVNLSPRRVVLKGKRL